MPLPVDKKAREMVLFFKELMDNGELRCVVDRQYSLEDIAEAYRYVELGEKTGSVVINVGH